MISEIAIRQMRCSVVIMEQVAQPFRKSQSCCVFPTLSLLISLVSYCFNRITEKLALQTK